MEKREAYSIGKLFLMYKTPIYQFIYRYCQDEQLCLDIVQDTFIRFQKYQKHFDEEKSSIKTYLFRMAYQLMINRLKRRSRLEKLLPFLYMQSQQHTLSHEDKLTVQSAILQLPDEQRAVILLTYYHDMPQKDISEILDIPIGTVKSRLYTSLRKLKALLEVSE
ncbi:RNA polymerase sigma factor [Gracilibacillus alcaliphilus]|uniref:RNA polymerase sigma factor n=1 Tax=Gracilibacillus alcaliphilus TaxID=1401441 RepID=UPI0030842282